MSQIFGLVLLVVVFGVALAGLVVGCVASSSTLKNKTLVNPGLVNPRFISNGSNVPTLFAQTAGLEHFELVPGSSTSAGSVKLTSHGNVPGLFNLDLGISVNFIPVSCILTIANLDVSTPYTAQLTELTVNTLPNDLSIPFVFVHLKGNTTTTKIGTVFYYLIV